MILSIGKFFRLMFLHTRVDRTFCVLPFYVLYKDVLIRPSETQCINTPERQKRIKRHKKFKNRTWPKGVFRAETWRESGNLKRLTPSRKEQRVLPDTTQEDHHCHSGDQVLFCVWVLTSWDLNRRVDTCVDAFGVQLCTREERGESWDHETTGSF